MRLLFRNYCYDYDYCYDDHQEKTIWHWQLHGLCTACVCVCVCMYARCVRLFMYIRRYARSIVDWLARLSHFCFTTIVAVLRECEKGEEKETGVVVMG